MWHLASREGDTDGRILPVPWVGSGRRLFAEGMSRLATSARSQAFFQFVPEGSGRASPGMSPKWSLFHRCGFACGVLIGLVDLNHAVGAEADATSRGDGSASEAAVPGMEGPDKLWPDWGGYRARWSERGLDFGATYAGEVLGNVSGGLKQGAIYEGLLRLEVDFDSEQAGVWKGGKFHGSMLYPHGRSLSEHYVGDLFTFSNIDAPDDVRLFELWYEQALVAKRLTLRLGQLGADEEFAFTEYGGTFVNGTCGWPAAIAANASTPAFPAATLGARLEARWKAGWSLRAGIYNGEPCPVDDAGQPLNRHGVFFGIRDAFVMVEAQKEWTLLPDSTGLPGSAKLGYWYHSGTFEDQRIDDGGLSLADPASSGMPRTHEGNGGFYLTAEQQVTTERGEASDQGLGLFARFGGSPSDRNALEFYAETGLVYKGLLPGRDNDGVGFAVVYGQLSRDARALAHDCYRYATSPAPAPDFEMVVETTYVLAMRPGLTFQPLMAWIIHPGGSTATDDSMVVGFRVVLDF